MLNRKVLHMTSVHYFKDTRIFYRMCLWLKKSGYDVTLLAPHTHDEVVEDIPVKAVRKFDSRIARMLLTTTHVLIRSFEEKYDIYHFHDPELIPVGLVLRLLGKNVVFDVHENVGPSILEKRWIPFPRLVQKVYCWFEGLAAKYMTVVLAENSYAKSFVGRAKNFTTVLNMPDSDYFKPYKVEGRQTKPPGIFYIGGISSERCIYIIFEALEMLMNSGQQFHFHCVGPVDSYMFERINSNKSYQNIKNKVTLYGRLPVTEGFVDSKKCRIGLSLLKPTKNYIESYPTKIFEYMSIGLPVVASNFPLYKEIVENSHCGVTVQPDDPIAVFNAIRSVLNDESLLETMSLNGVKAISEKYNWSNEFKKLDQLYHSLH